MPRRQQPGSGVANVRPVRKGYSDYETVLAFNRNSVIAIYGLSSAPEEIADHRRAARRHHRLALPTAAAPPRSARAHSARTARSHRTSAAPIAIRDEDESVNHRRQVRGPATEQTSTPNEYTAPRK